MLVLRCTRCIRARLRLPDDLPEPARSTGILGDWYVHLIRFGRNQLVLATSERSLLTVLLSARELRQNLAPNLRSALGALLAIIGVPREAIHREIATMTPVAFARATNRRVLGSMNDFAFQATVQISRGEHDPLLIGRRLAATPMSAIGLKPGDLGFPDKLTCELLSAGST